MVSLAGGKLWSTKEHPGGGPTQTRRGRRWRWPAQHDWFPAQHDWFPTQHDWSAAKFNQNPAAPHHNDKFKSKTGEQYLSLL